MICNCKENFALKLPEQFLQIAEKYKVAKLSDGSDTSTLVPFSMVLEPFCVTSSQYDKLKKYSYLWQKITHLASMDKGLLIKTLSPLKKDPMIGPMLKIYKKMMEIENNPEKPHKRKPQIELFRTDFFITEEKKNNIKIIQYNNMSVSMAGISQQYEKSQKQFWGSHKVIIQNKCTQTYSQSIVNFYNKSKLDGILLTVIKNKQTNIIDQGLLFQQVKKKSDIQIEKVYLQDLNKQITLLPNNDLMFKQKKVAIVYYRAGYSSNEKIDWEAIQKCNLSNAVNIPSINSFLIGSKKMQSQLSKKETMKKYLTDQEADLLLQSVIDTWDFDGENSKQKIIQLIQKQGIDNFILKPNEQGGKNNFFGKDAYHKIKELSEEQLINFILTRKIESRKQKCTLLCSKKWNQLISQCCSIQSQTSIYGTVYSGCNCVIFDQKAGSCICKCAQTGCCLQNCCQGYLVRSKPEGVNQGGLMAGTGAICGLQLKQPNKL